tara:strand:+ start:2590 stop:3705 length:1116 start_codon:yes stop_codon:yes gene_type:complete
MFKQLKRKSNIQRFLKWTRRELPSKNGEERFSTFIKENFPDSHFTDGEIKCEHLAEVQSTVSDWLNRLKNTNVIFDISEVNKKFSVRNVRGANLALNVSSYCALDLTECEFDEVYLAPHRQVKLKNCWIGDLRAEAKSFSGAELRDTWVRRLSIKHNSLIGIEVFGGGILDFQCPLPGEPSPFFGPVIFKDVFVPRTRKGFPISGAQTYRNLRHHLTTLQNMPAAQFFHSAEQAIERDDETGLNWLLNYLYENLSDYGASPARPLILLGWLWLINTLYLMGDGVAIGGKVAAAVGWQKALYSDGLTGEVLRAVILGAQPISWIGSLISPGKAVPLIPNSLLMQVWLVVAGMISAVLLALFAFAVRRRFKIT